MDGMTGHVLKINIKSIRAEFIMGLFLLLAIYTVDQGDRFTLALYQYLNIIWHDAS